MRIAFLDHSGCGLGLAIGLVELGHHVAYTGPQRWAGDPHGDVERMIRELLDRYCGGNTPRVDTDADLLVILDGFADLLDSLHAGRQVVCRIDLAAPLRATLNPLIYPERLRLWLQLASAARSVVAIDCSDLRGPCEPAFERLPHCALLAREVGRDETGPWRPFPFLYNPVLLWLEHLRPQREWLVPGSSRRATWDWAFCGTVDHPRYRGRRQALLQEVGRRWPGLRGCVPTTVPFAEVLRVLQSSRCGLDLPGAGELCFRLHECLALGVPVLRPWPFSIALPPGVEAAIVRDPAASPALDLEAVRAVHLQHYAPRVAAAALLANAAATRQREASVAAQV
ncbi:MAG TPA: hypothetical protein VK348_12990 [Planctomycetota bacterium]|nr:hypothetical protein [Planctomycetota bacterium]